MPLLPAERSALCTHDGEETTARCLPPLGAGRARRPTTVQASAARRAWRCVAATAAFVPAPCAACYCEGAARASPPSRSSDARRAGRAAPGALSRRAALHNLAVTTAAVAAAVAEADPVRAAVPSDPQAQAAAADLAAAAAEADIDPLVSEPELTHRVFVDLAIGKPPVPRSHTARLEIALYGSLLPITVSNFVALCRSRAYADTPVYRIVPGLTVQLGDVLRNGGRSGRAAVNGGEPFVPDGFRVKHSMPGLVSMVRAPDGRVDSRFFVATREGDSFYLDGRYAAFGRVVTGMDFLKLVEKEGGEGFVRKLVRVVDCGVLAEPAQK